METKIPPPIVTLIFGLAIYLSRTIFPEIEIQYSSFFGMVLLLLGFFILISAVKLFRNDKTTVNPLSPEQATKLVTNGIFKLSRNPMYLGMAVILASVAVFFNIIHNKISNHSRRKSHERIICSGF
jgi:protein-S-isoprenylcysteine O-methyltransferase Ste14